MRHPHGVTALTKRDEGFPLPDNVSLILDGALCLVARHEPINFILIDGILR